MNMQSRRGMTGQVYAEGLTAGIGAMARCVGCSLGGKKGYVLPFRLIFIYLLFRMTATAEPTPAPAPPAQDPELPHTARHLQYP